MIRSTLRGQEEPGEGEEGGLVAVALRLPNGGTAQRRFRENEPVSRLYDWALTLDALFQEERQAVGLYEPFPRRRLPDSHQTLQDLCLAPRTALAALVE